MVGSANKTLGQALDGDAALAVQEGEPRSIGGLMAYLRDKYGLPADLREWSAALATMPAPEPEDLCPTCRGSGMVDRTKPNPFASVPIYRAASCPTCHGADAEIAASLWARSGIAEYEQEHYTFQRFDTKLNPTQEIMHALAAARQWAAGVGPPFLVLMSQTKGVGKTHLAVAAAAGCIARLEPVRFLVVPVFLEELRMSFGEQGKERLAALRYGALETPNLILDDFGAEKSTPWVDTQLFQLLDARYRQGARTLVTSNVPIDEWEERVASRLTDMERSTVVTCKGRDVRAMRRPQLSIVS